jgi:hypothetical protein
MGQLIGELKECDLLLFLRLERNVICVGVAMQPARVAHLGDSSLIQNDEALLDLWRENGLQGYDGIVWFRGAVTLEDEGRLAGRRNELGVFLGPPVSGGYEVYAGGHWIGRSRGWSSALPFGSPEVFRVPRNGINPDGTVSLALRVRRIGWASDRDPVSAFALNTFASTYWIYEITASRRIATRLTDLSGHLAAAFAIHFPAST